MAKKPSFRPDFDPKFFFEGFTSTRLLQANIACNFKKTNEPTFKKWQKNLILGLILAHFGPPKLWVLPLLDVRNCYKLSLYAISRKTNETNLRKWQKKPQFQARLWSLWHKFYPQEFFSWILSLLDVKNCCKPSLHAISKEFNKPNLRKWQKKPLVSGQILLPLTQICIQKIFFIDFNCTRCYILLQAIIYAISRKTNEPNLRKWQKTQFWAQFWSIWPKCEPQMFFQKYGLVSHQILCSAIIMYTIRKN